MLVRDSASMDTSDKILCGRRKSVTLSTDTKMFRLSVWTSPYRYARFVNDKLWIFLFMLHWRFSLHSHYFQLHLVNDIYKTIKGQWWWCIRGQGHYLYVINYRSWKVMFKSQIWNRKGSFLRPILTFEKLQWLSIELIWWAHPPWRQGHPLTIHDGA